ncbi:MAG: DUF2892 domain-containing protein [Nitrospinae bacterium]|nr:DUF2892 domain-containing protein [Nitrospinota bacterium]
MKKNVGNCERIARVVLGLFLVSLVFWGPKTLWGLIGIIPILTGSSGNCPLYTVAGISTCKCNKDS